MKPDNKVHFLPKQRSLPELCFGKKWRKTLSQNYYPRHPWSACDNGECDWGGVLPLPDCLDNTKLHQHSWASPDLQTSQGYWYLLDTHKLTPNFLLQIWNQTASLFCALIITLIFILPSNWSKWYWIFNLTQSKQWNSRVISLQPKHTSWKDKFLLKYL